MATQRGGRWVARPVLAGLIRVLIVVVPAVAGALASWELSRVWEQPSEFWPTVGWFLTLVAVAVAVVLVVQRFARRFLPLAWLFSLTMAFPDHTPSRMVTARRAASRRARRKALHRLKEDGLGRDAGEASEAALVLVAALGAHDRRTRGHSERVRTLADLLAEEAGLSDEERDKLRWGALLHDIGKLAVPGDILNKPDRPDEDEWATLQRHPEEGAHLVEPLVTWLGPWAGAVGHHHEKWDGTGYPQGLAGEDISLGGADPGHRRRLRGDDRRPGLQGPDVGGGGPRRSSWPRPGTHFDPALVRAFMGISLGALWWTSGRGRSPGPDPAPRPGRRRFPGVDPDPIGARRVGHGGGDGRRPGRRRSGRRRQQPGRAGRRPRDRLSSPPPRQRLRLPRRHDAPATEAVAAAAPVATHDVPPARPSPSVPDDRQPARRGRHHGRHDHAAAGCPVRSELPGDRAVRARSAPGFAHRTAAVHRPGSGRSPPTSSAGSASA